ncbi:unnamed protein product [Lasius platythorax]|uniref:Uncharacterized protein n=1 Tax=Lasius platythorax TaxID=488582 RepID=A0AAV2NMX8_9HYME
MTPNSGRCRGVALLQCRDLPTTRGSPLPRKAATEAPKSKDLRTDLNFVSLKRDTEPSSSTLNSLLNLNSNSNSNFKSYTKSKP